ncbi:28S ribosomal protein S35, mitochondrial-like isoform X2 [Paramacrobiotus metropolitanus]|uniref:28S ribosomal protein S35, mitochondrial-like isoform X2 n=1 Tax=Paramacrobiotus metropolitanus TaxID=2943436 RepID=UPI002446591E|nr:28S ribosomal protein S35, mitochondrial-like isoform X2 [Paramacrobiotus metropolitanus]
MFGLPQKAALVRYPALRHGMATSASSVTVDKHDDLVRESREFRQLSLSPARKERKREEDRRFRSQDLMPPRSQRMHVDQDWTNVWPAAATFKPATVPLPIRTSTGTSKTPLDKFGNTELMKIPNFFHLTPLAIAKHCAALKKFCTPWPKELQTEEDCNLHFPVEVITATYCHSGPSIRNTRTRIVSLRVKLSELKFDFHARDKFLRLLGDRYDPKSDYITIVTDRCPTRQQNYDYAKYLLTALYFESWKTEPWEKEMTVADRDRYYWEGSPSEESAKTLLARMAVSAVQPGASPKSAQTDDVPPGNAAFSRSHEHLREYEQAVTTVNNGEENFDSLRQYKTAVLKLAGLN